MSEKEAEARLGALDGLRGLAALGVVVWHYQHFGGNAAEYPYRSFVITGWLYERGWLMVEFFFVLSGCVFTHKYLQMIAARRILAREFFLLRISRIYPLHLATLVIVAAIQWWRLAHNEPTHIFGHNDLYHFFLNLVFLHSSGFEQGPQYNGPSWSIAVEMFAYLAFFVLARASLPRYVGGCVLFVLFALGAFRAEWNYPFVNGFVARGFLGFFTGSLLFLGLGRLREQELGTRSGLACLIALGVIGCLVHWLGYGSFVIGKESQAIPVHEVVIFPLVVAATLMLAPIGKALSLRPLTFLGDISFTVYLAHVPLQMVMLSFFESRGARPPTSDARFFWTFFGLLVLVSVAIHKLMEVPVRKWIRRRFITGSE